MGQFSMIALGQFSLLIDTVIDEVDYLHYGADAANVLYHVVNDRHLARRPMIFTTNKPPSDWGAVLHDNDLAETIVDRVLEHGRFITVDGPTGPVILTQPFSPERPEFLEKTGRNIWTPHPDPPSRQKGRRPRRISVSWWCRRQPRTQR